MKIEFDKKLMEEIKEYTTYGDDIILEPLFGYNDMLGCAVYIKKYFMKIHIKNDYDLNFDKILKILNIKKAVLRSEYEGDILIKKRYFIKTVK